MVYIYTFTYNLIENLYILALVISCCYAMYKPMYTNLINITNNIQNKQDILYKDICKIKTIIDIDNNTHSGVSSPDNDSSDEENIIPQNYVTLPIQNHITFPHYWIFNDTNFKQIRLPHNKYEVRIFGNNLRLISNELAKFLKIKKGTCMEFDEGYKYVYEYIQNNEIVNICDDKKLCKLFGLSENEDYEFTDVLLIKNLKKMLEPHFRQITYGIV